MVSCPKCDGKTRCTSTRPGFRWRKCQNRECGHKFKTSRGGEHVLLDNDQLTQLLAQYGLSVRPVMLDQLSNFSISTIRRYLENADLIISNYQASTGHYVKDHAGFICNAILTGQPIPQQEVEVRPRETLIEPEAAEIWQWIQDSHSHITIIQRAQCLGLFNNRLVVLAFNDNEKELMKVRYMDTLREYTDGYNIKIVS